MTDELIAAYLVCGNELNPMERQHGYILNVWRRDGKYVWKFVDKFIAEFDEDGHFSD